MPKKLSNLHIFVLELMRQRGADLSAASCERSWRAGERWTLDSRNAACKGFMRQFQSANDSVSDLPDDTEERIARIKDDDKLANALGDVLAHVLYLKKDREHRDRWVTGWGTKTNIGLTRTTLRILLDWE